MPLHDLLGVPATVRASFSLYNTTGEIDALIDALHFARDKVTRRESRRTRTRRAAGHGVSADDNV